MRKKLAITPVRKKLYKNIKSKKNITQEIESHNKWIKLAFDHVKNYTVCTALFIGGLILDRKLEFGVATTISVCLLVIIGLLGLAWYIYHFMLHVQILCATKLNNIALRLIISACLATYIPLVLATLNAYLKIS